MEKCKFCQAELAENGTFCPNCGRNNAEDAQETGVTEETVSQEAAPAQEAEPVQQPAPAQESEAVQEAAPTRESEIAQEAAPAAEEAKPEKKATPGKIALAVAAVVVLAAALIALLMAGRDNRAEDGTVESEPAQQTVVTEAVATVPADGNPDDETCKGTYTVTDEAAQAARDIVVATAGDAELTNGQLQVYYWSMVNSYLSSEMGYYLMMYGVLDYTQPLDTQLYYEGDGRTWQQYFLQEALGYWQMSLALAEEGEKAGLDMSQEMRDYLDNLDVYLQETADSYSMTVEQLLLHNVGPGAGVEEFASFQELYGRGNVYYAQEIAKIVPTDADLEAFFAEHEEEYASSGITRDGSFVDVRHILIGLEGGTEGEDGVITYSEEDWANAEEKAQSILDSWLAGEQTEESFAALANEKSEDAGSNTNGGLYQQVYEGQMVTAFNDWCFDEARRYGDYDIVETEYGYHIMYFVSSTPMWRYYTESDWINQETNTFIEELTSAYPLKVSYEDIVLGYVNLAG